MKLKLNGARIVRNWPVKVSMPMDGGEVQEVVISMHLKRPRPADMATFYMQPPVEELAKGVEAARKWKASKLAPFVVGWGNDVVGDDDQPLPFSAERLETLLLGEDGVAFEVGIFDALVQIMNARAPEKNLSPLLSTLLAPAVADTDGPSATSEGTSPS